MAEEIEAVRVTIQGTEIVAKLAGTTLKEAMLIMKFFAELFSKGISEIWSSDAIAKRLQNKLNKIQIEEYKNSIKKMNAGSMSYKEFNKTYNANERKIIQIPDESMVEFQKLASQQGIAYCLLPDNNLNDGLKEIMVTTLQAEAVSDIIEKISQKEMERNKSAIDELTKKKDYIDKEIEKLETKKRNPNITEELKNEYETNINYLKKASNQLEKEINLTDKLLTKEISMKEYTDRNIRCTQCSDILAKEYEAGINQYGCFSLNDVISENPIETTSKSSSTLGESYIQSIGCPNVVIKKSWNENKNNDKEFDYNCKYELYVDGEKTNISYESNTYIFNESEMTEFISNVNQRLEDEMEKKIDKGEVVYTREKNNWTEVPDMKEINKRIDFTKKNPLTINGMTMEEFVNDYKQMKEVNKKFSLDKNNKSNPKETIEKVDIDITRITKSYNDKEKYEYFIDKNTSFIFEPKHIENINKKTGTVELNVTELFKNEEKSIVLNDYRGIEKDERGRMFGGHTRINKIDLINKLNEQSTAKNISNNMDKFKEGVKNFGKNVKSSLDNFKK